MFLSFALYEQLNMSGKIESFHIYPMDSSPLVTDWQRDVSDICGIHQVDLGPLRIYTGEDGLKITRTVSQLSQHAFENIDKMIRIKLNHRGLPIKNETVGFYGLLLPPEYYGEIECNVPIEKIWLSDVNRLFISCELPPWDNEWKYGLEISGKLILKKQPDSNVAREQSFDIFKSGIDGLHHTSVRNFLRAVNRGLDSNVSSAFICHSSSDKVFARRIATGISSRGYKVWLDEAEIKIGDSLIDKIEKGILKSDKLVAILSKKSVESKWCQEELRMALAMQIENKPIRVLPVLIDDCEIPGFLKEKVYADFKDEWSFESSLEDICDAMR